MAPMISPGMVFRLARDPARLDSDLRLPHLAWAVLMAITGEHTVAQIGRAFDLDPDARNAVFSQLLAEGLLSERKLSYSEYLRANATLGEDGVGDGEGKAVSFRAFLRAGVTLGQPAPAPAVPADPSGPVPTAPAAATVVSVAKAPTGTGSRAPAADGMSSATPLSGAVHIGSNAARPPSDTVDPTDPGALRTRRVRIPEEATSDATEAPTRRLKLPSRKSEAESAGAPQAPPVTSPSSPAAATGQAAAATGQTNGDLEPVAFRPLSGPVPVVGSPSDATSRGGTVEVPAESIRKALGSTPSKPSRRLSLRAVMHFILERAADLEAGQLDIYRVFIRVNTKLLKRNGITTLRFEDDRLVKDPELQDAITTSVERTLGLSIPETVFV